MLRTPRRRRPRHRPHHGPGRRDAPGTRPGRPAVRPTDSHGSSRRTRTPRCSIEQRVADLLARMTLKEKIGQMTQAERTTWPPTPVAITTLKLGSVLSGGGSVPAANTPDRRGPTWSTTTRTQALATRLHIPIIYGVDSVHGHGNLKGATVFPHNIGLGATRDPRAGQEDRRHHRAGDARVRTAVGVRAVHLRGPRRPLGPHLRVATARTRSWSRRWRPASTGSRAGTASKIDRFHVLASAKHFAGDGLTTYGTPTGDYKRRPGHRPGLARGVRQAGAGAVLAGRAQAQRRLGDAAASPASTGPRTASATR